MKSRLNPAGHPHFSRLPALRTGLALGSLSSLLWAGAAAHGQGISPAPEGTTGTPPTRGTTDPGADVITEPALFVPEPGPAESVYVPATLPLMPWLPAEAPQVPDWSFQDSPPSPFLRPGFGTSSLGGSGLPSGPLPGRRSQAVPPFQIGPVDLRPSLSYEVRYGSGVLAGPDRDEDTWQHTITPRLQFFVGDRWAVSYVPNILIYSADGYENTVNHTVTLGGSATYKNWDFRLNHVTAFTFNPLIETAQQTDQTIHSTGLGATWSLGQRGMYDVLLRQSIRLLDQNESLPFASRGDVYSWSVENWYDYPWRPRIAVGVGLGLGYDLVDRSTDMLNQRPSLRLTGRLGSKWSYNVTGGAEFREFMGTDTPTSISPLVSGRIGYQIEEDTSVSVGMSHDIGPSFFRNQFTETTSVSGAITRRITPRWDLAANGGYRFTSYQSTGPSTTVEREDNTAFAGVSLSATLLPRLRASLSYMFQSNDSDQEGFNFDSHQVAFALNWTP